MKRLIFVLAVETIALVALLVVALDVRLHRRFEMLGGLNIKGYRGHVMPARQPGELRIAVVGGSFAFGWGVAAPETFSGYLGRLVTERLRTRTSPPTRATDVNLAEQGIEVQDYVDRIRHFSYLKPDVIVLVPDRFETGAAPADGMPQRSGVYALTGYLPILPIVLKEKGRLLQENGQGRLASRVGRLCVLFGASLDAADLELRSLMTDVPPPVPYDAAFAESVAVALETARHVIVVVPLRPWIESPETAYVKPVRDSTVPWVYTGVGRESYLNDTNLGAGGNSQVAGTVVPTVLDLVAR